MQSRFFLGFLVAALLSWQLSAVVYHSVMENVNPWLWLIGIPALGYWVGQAPARPFWRGAVCGWIAPGLILWLPLLDNLKGYVSSWPYIELTGLLFCLPAALGQLRCYLRKAPQNRLPE